jgi:hypothetical protein
MHDAQGVVTRRAAKLAEQELPMQQSILLTPEAPDSPSDMAASSGNHKRLRAVPCSSSYCNKVKSARPQEGMSSCH